MVLRKLTGSQAEWDMPIVPATQEAETEGLQTWGSPGKLGENLSEIFKKGVTIGRALA